MPSKAFKLAESIVSNPIMNDIVTNTTAVPATITTQIATSTDQGVSTVADLPDTGNNPGDIQLVEATNRLYVWNGSGWYNIALINTSPTWDSGGQPSGSYVLDADSPQDATIITLAASDPEGLPITYSYITSGSMDSMATISQDSSVFTITPKTVTEVGEGVELTGGITFRASDGVNILPYVSNFTLDFVFIIQNSKYTTLLATAVDTSDNNNITDSSTSNHTITVNGDAHAGTFSPYRNNYSTYFDGNDNYTVPNGLHLGTGDFTFEFWIWMDEDTTTTQRTFISGETSGTGVGWRFGLDTYAGYNGLTFGYGQYGSYTVGKYVNNYWLPSGEWTHLAAQRRSGTIEIYINGVSQTLTTYNENGTFSDGANLTSTQTSRTFFSNVKGYVADLRLVTGSYVYDGNFTPSTENITAVTNTVLLTNQNQFPYLVDNSSNAYAITVNGNTSIKPFSRHDTDKYTSTDHGGSIYFDGTDDALEISDNADFDLSGGSWTIECWWYPLVVNTYDGIFNQWNGASVASGRNINVSWESDRLYLFGYDGGTFISSIYHDVTAAQLQNRWNHVAAVFDGTKTELYLNGEASGRAYVSSNNLSKDVASEPFRVAKHHRLTSYYYNNSYVSDLRLVKGTAVYTGAFTPPSGPLTTTGGTYPSTTNVNTSITASHTKLFLKGADASIIDKSQTNNLQLVGNTTGSTTQVKFADTKSMYFDGAGDYIKPNDVILPLTQGVDYTIEGWFYADTITGVHPMVSQYVSGNGGRFSILVESSVLKFFEGGSPRQTISVNTGTWYHFLMCRSGTTHYAFMDGTLVGSSWTSSTNIVNTPTLIGHFATPTNYYFDGFLQDIRITKGLARYTANFTPPTEPLKG